MQVYTHCDLILHKWQIKMPMNPTFHCMSKRLVVNFIVELHWQRAMYRNNKVMQIKSILKEKSIR